MSKETVIIEAQAIDQLNWSAQLSILGWVQWLLRNATLDELMHAVDQRVAELEVKTGYRAPRKEAQS